MDLFLYDRNLRHERVNQFQTKVSFFYTPWKHQESRGFSEDLEREDYLEMDYKNADICKHFSST